MGPARTSPDACHHLAFRLLTRWYIDYKVSKQTYVSNTYDSKENYLAITCLDETTQFEFVQESLNTMKNEADFGVIEPNGKEDESGMDFPSGKCSGPSGTLDPLGKQVLNTQLFLVTNITKLILWHTKSKEETTYELFNGIWNDNLPDQFQNLISAQLYSTDSSAGPKLQLDLPWSFHVLKGSPAWMTIVSQK